MDNRLIAMLQGAKSVMNKVEGKEGMAPQQPQQAQQKQQVPQQMQQQPNQMVEGHQLLESLPPGVQPQQSVNPARPMPSNFKNINTTKMPKAIVDSMVNNQIPSGPVINQAGMPTFSLEDVASMVNPNANQQPVYQQPQVNENVQQPQVNNFGQKTITLTEAELDAKIKNALFEFMATTFTKTLTEATIKKTIGTLIKEGKLKVTQKKK